MNAADVLVIGAGPAGAAAALRAADLGARVTLLTRGEFGGMAANDGPVPVRTLAHAARLLRDTHQLETFGISIGRPALDYTRLLARVDDVVEAVRKHAAFREPLDRLGVKIHERTGTARFIDPHTVACERGPEIHADKIIICAGGVSRRLGLPGFELTATHSDAWSLKTVPSSMLVIGGGATGAQVASIFNAFGTRVQFFEAGPRILRTEDEDVSAAVASGFRAAGIAVRENFGAIERFEKTAGGVRMVFAKAGVRETAEAALAVAAIGWVADAQGLGLAQAGVATDQRGYVKVDAHLSTSQPHILAAGDVTGQRMLVPQALQDGFVAATNAVRGAGMTREDTVNPIGSFTDPEYAQVGLSEAKAREKFDVFVSTVNFDSTSRTIIDGRTTGFCKLLVDRKSKEILGCHVVGERAVEIVQVVSIAMTAHMRVGELARIPLSFPTYAGILGRVAAIAARELNIADASRASPP
jgi:dihydrolipoamide dehydrogenase